MKYTTFIFDLDGTLLDTLEDLAAAVNYALKKNGYPIRSIDEVQSFIGNGVANLIERALGGRVDCFEKTLADFKEYYGAHCAVKTGLYDGIEEVLLAIKAAGKKCAVVSNKADFAVKILAKQYFDGLLGVAIGENEAAGVRKKPAPDSVFLALKELGENSLGAVYIGDSEVDIQTAKNAGVTCICVTWGFRDKAYLMEEGGRLFVDEPNEILTYIEGAGTR